MKIKNVRRIALILSILLHLLLILLLQEADRLDSLFSKEPEPQETFDNRLVFELVETPDDALIDEPDNETDLVSDTKARVRDMSEDVTDQTDLPFSEGDIVLKEFQQPEIIPAPESGTSSESSEEDNKEIEENSSNIVESNPNTLSEDSDNDADKSNSSPQKKTPRKLNFENLISGASEQGGISFNTYDWNFAPYLLAMKKRIESNWNPPFAFTHMGAISGVNQYRFKVMPSGTVKDLELLGTNAHYSLDQSSSMAIEGSSPFMPLPLEFPEDYLEVTVTFSYNIMNK